MMLVFVTLCCIIASSAAQETTAANSCQPPAAYIPILYKMYNILDGNRDKNVTWTEAKEVFFSFYDKDGNGCITQIEFQQQQCQIHKNLCPSASAVAVSFDLNSDGCIRDDDIEASKPNLDADGNNVISWDEFYKFYVEKLCAYAF